MDKTEELARWLHDARTTRRPVPQPEGVALDLPTAYAVQHAGVALRLAAGERRVGAKMGFTSRAKMAQMGVHEMIVGQLTDAMEVPDGSPFRRDGAIHPRIEPEVAFLVGRDFADVPHAGLLRGAVEAIAPAMEIIDSRYANFRFSLADVVADNTSACGFVLGAWQPVPREIDNLGMALRVDGRPRQAGSSAAILGSPWRALDAAWRLARRYGVSVPAGSVLLAGAATAAEPMPERGFVEVEVSGLGRAAFTVGIS
ncbi:MAG TPA: fumarylacetoacetate hydrolase family protein [Ramlibacter sp.]|nr:fumarylacetoacetate hydrolase family protein [Ramlibacter sp.]